MTSNAAWFRRIGISALGLLFIISLAFNVVHYKMLIAERKDNVNMSNNYISNHEASFSNAFEAAGGTDMMEYIKNPDHLSEMMESIQYSEFNYLAASKYETKKSGFMQSRELILNGYLSELRSYRTYLASNAGEPYENMNQLAMDMKDLQTISSWLTEKYKKNDFEVYTDQDFYQDIYMNLKSTVKGNYFKNYSNN